MRVGQAVSSGRPVSPGVHHVAAVRRGATLQLYLDGALLAEERDAAGAILDLGELPELMVGRGPRAPFAGQVTGAVIHGEAVDAWEIARLAGVRPMAAAVAGPAAGEGAAGG